MMNFNTVNVIKKIDNNSVDSIKEAIFKRAEAKNGSVESGVRNDIMAQASSEIRRSASNPFLQGVFSSAQAAPAEAAVAQKAVPVQSNNNVSTPQVNVGRKIAQNINLQTGLYNSAMRESIMIQASEQMVKNNDLMSRLSFLNTKMAISSYPAKQF